MSLVTPKLGLVKPASIEQFNLATYNNNLDIIDTKWTEQYNRLGFPLGHMGKTSSFQALGGVITKVTMDAAQFMFGGFTFSNADDALVIPFTGRYWVRTKGFFSGAAAGVNQTGIMINGSAPNGPIQSIISNASKMDGNDIFAHSSANMAFTAGDKVALWQYSAQSCWGTNGYDGSWLELEWAGTN